MIYWYMFYELHFRIAKMYIIKYLLYKGYIMSDGSLKHKKLRYETPYE